MNHTLKTSVIIAVGLALLVSCDKVEVNEPVIEVSNPILEAGDMRDGANPALALGLTDANKDMRIAALKALGHIGGAAASEKISPAFNDENADVRRMAAFAAGISGDDLVLTAMRERVRVEEDDTVAAELYSAMGRLIDETGLIYLSGELTLTQNEIRQRGIIDGMMQVIAYKRMKAADVKGLDFAKVLAMTQQEGELSKAASYFLARLGDLSAVLSSEDITAAYDGAINIEAKTLLLRMMRSNYTMEDAVYLEALNGNSGALKIEAIKGLQRSKTEAANLALRDAALNGSPALRFQALALPREVGLEDMERYMANLDLFVEGVKASSDMVAAQALSGLAKLDEPAALEVAKAWFAGDNDYRKAKAIEGMLTQDSYRTEIIALSTDNSNPHVRDAARIALGLPELEGDTPPRETISSVEALAATGKEITFSTTRGEIIIKTLRETPYMAYNFVSLAKEGGFDGMLFHRVIGNFVAQAGERTNADFAHWGTVREEWHPGLGHEIGTVGVATSGKDTGTLQFFFNINNNRHLDGRYTVFAKVVKGMDVMMALEQGDIIISATVN